MRISDWSSYVCSSDLLVARRARLYERFPVRERIKRGWIEATKSIDGLEHQCLAFFGIQALDAEISFCHAAKKTAPAEMPTALQLAWLCQARRLASEMVTTLYSEAALRASLPRLSALLTAPEETRHLATILDEWGERKSGVQGKNVSVRVA